MREITTGKTRGLQQLANANGIFQICAMDHRDSLKQMLKGEGAPTVSFHMVVDFKLDLCRVLAPHSSAVLLDPIYGASQAIAAAVLPGNTGLLISMEDSDYDTVGGGRITKLLPDWGADKARQWGASAAKLLLYYRPDLPDVASRQLNTVRMLADDCRKEDIALLVEPKSYIVHERDAEDFARRKPGIVIDTAREVTELPIDVLKVEFPADMKYEHDEGRLAHLCQQLNEVCQVPWVILSAGADFDVFRRQVEIACRAGASGFLAGRSVWQEATKKPSREERLAFLENTAARRLDHLADIANRFGIPWSSRLRSMESAPLDAPGPQTGRLAA